MAAWNVPVNPARDRDVTDHDGWRAPTLHDLPVEFTRVRDDPGEFRGHRAVLERRHPSSSMR